MKKKLSIFLLTLVLFFWQKAVQAQSTQIRGFADVDASYQRHKVAFSLGEQDLFITSEINDRFNFLGETVFKFSPGSPTTFNVSVERIIVKYNFSGNHNILVGKHHTPINYWNDTYHHGRVFFPTIERPLLFAADIVPLHTTGISLQGHDLGTIRFGYDLMLGNGIGSTDVADNDRHKSVTAAVHIKPVDELRLGASFYHDVISKGAKLHDGGITNWQINQQLWTGSVAYFGNKFELLSEATWAFNKSDTTGRQQNIGSYAYAGYKIKEKWVPYVRVDHLHFGPREILFHADNTTALIAGFRYLISPLAVIKLEYEHDHREIAGENNKVSAQLAVGF